MASSWSPRHAHRVARFGEKLLLVGGLCDDGTGLASSAGDVWEGDGSEWHRVEDVGARDGHALVTVGDVLLIGGAFPTAHDVWRYDGAWHLVTSAPGWCGRTHHECVVDAKTVILLGGLSESGYLNDAWRSRDFGVTWERRTKHADWSPRAMHGSACRRGAIFVAGGYGTGAEASTNDVWASTDHGATWIRLCHRAPWLPRRGHCLVATQDLLILAGGQGSSGISFGDCWTSHDGASWSLVCFDAPPRHLFASVLLEDVSSSGRRLLVLGGASTRGKGDDEMSGTERPSVSHNDAFTIPLVASEEDVVARKADPGTLEVSMGSVVAALAELRQLRAALREVQRGNVQLCTEARAATSFDEAQRALTTAAEEDDDEKHERLSDEDTKPIRSRSSSALLAASFSARLQRAFVASLGGGGSGTKPTFFFPNPNESDRSSNTKEDSPPDDEQSCSSFFDARTAESCDPPSEQTIVMTPQKIQEDVPTTTNVTALSVAEAALAVDGAMVTTWRETIAPLNCAILETADVEATVLARDAKIRAAARVATKNVRGFDALEAAARALKERSRAALGRMHHRMALEEEQAEALKDLPADEDLASWLETAEVDGESFEEVEAALRAHCVRPERTNSARRATDLALTKFGEVLQKRADAADALRASILYVATDKDHENEQTRLEEEVGRRSRASAAEWDDRSDEGVARLEAHAAVGAELAVIPRELDDALALKKRLLTAAQKRCEKATSNAAGLQLLASVLRRRAMTWARYLEDHDKDAVRRLCAFADDARDRLLQLEDARVDVISALETVNRRKRSRLNFRSSKLDDDDRDDGDSRSLVSLATGGSVVPLDAEEEDDSDDDASPPGESLDKTMEPQADLLTDLFLCRSSDQPKVSRDLETLEGTFQGRARLLDRKIAAQRRRLRRAVALAARRALTVAPEVARESPVLVDSLDRLNVLGLDVGDDQAYLSPSTRSGTIQKGGWFWSPWRRVSDYEDVEVVNNKVCRGVDRTSGEAVLLKAYNLQEETDAEWATHEAEISALMALPRHEAVAGPRAIVAGEWAPVGLFDLRKAISSAEETMNAMVYLEFPLPETDGPGWAAEKDRAPWHVQAVARQILTALIVLHSHGVVHDHLTPRTVILVRQNRQEHRALLATRHLVACLDDDDTKEDEMFVAPEVRRGEVPSTSSDMYAFGATLQWIHDQVFSKKHPDEDLRRLLSGLLNVDADKRPSAADAMLHPYFQNSYLDRFIAGGDLVGQNEKLDAVRDLVKRVRSEMRGLPGRRKLVIHRDRVVEEVLAHFAESHVRDLAFAQEKKEHHVTRWPMQVQFVGEEGVDEGGLTAEMFALFFHGVIDDAAGLFESRGGGVSLPRPPPEDPLEKTKFLAKLEAVGRALVTACYEGCGAPSKLAPSLFKFIARGATHVAAGDARALRDLQKFDPALGTALENMLTKDATDWGLDFSDVVNPDDLLEEAAPENTPAREKDEKVTEANKHQFVVYKARWVLTGCRVDSLTAMRRGFERALDELSPEASPFLRLLSSTDLRVMLCSDDDDLTPATVLSCLTFVRFPRTSIVPDAMRRTISAFSIDSLRRFLVFATGSPSLPNDRRNFSIQVRSLGLQGLDALPVSHTCFFHIDIPDYPDEDTFIQKFSFALFECNSFSIV